MAHYAIIGTDGIVQTVITGRDEGETVNGISDWEAYYSSKYDGLLCKRTSYNTRGGVHYTQEYDADMELIPSADQSKALRKNFASVGFTYDATRDAFIPVKPFESWVLSEDTCLWEPPISYPADGGVYEWDESLTDWVEIEPTAISS